MALMKWDHTLSVQIDSIDTQHQKLVALLNKLHDAMAAGTGRQVVGSVLDELVSYTKEHFAFEEGLMKKAAYPDFPNHQVEHAKLTAQAVELQKNVKNGQAMTMDVMNFLVNWLSQHIMKVDKKYIPYVRK
jgi:hemerythrin